MKRKFVSCRTLALKALQIIGEYEIHLSICNVEWSKSAVI